MRKIFFSFLSVYWCLIQFSLLSIKPFFMQICLNSVAIFPLSGQNKLVFRGVLRTNFLQHSSWDVCCCMVRRAGGCQPSAVDPAQHLSFRQHDSHKVHRLRVRGWGSSNSDDRHSAYSVIIALHTTSGIFLKEVEGGANKAVLTIKAILRNVMIFYSCFHTAYLSLLCDQVLTTEYILYFY
jgi:hypothetical protein